MPSTSPATDEVVEGIGPERPASGRRGRRAAAGTRSGTTSRTSPDRGAAGRRHVGRRRQVGRWPGSARSAARSWPAPRPGRSRRPRSAPRCSARSRWRRTRSTSSQAGRVEVLHRADGRSGGRDGPAGRAGSACRSSQVPYGWLSTAQRRSFLTTSRWLSSFSWVMAGSRLAHAIRLEPERRARARGWAASRSSSCDPARSMPLSVPPRLLDEGEVLALGHVLRALEHHVLEQVREAGAPGPLVACCRRRTTG